MRHRVPPPVRSRPVSPLRSARPAALLAAVLTILIAAAPAAAFGPALRTAAVDGGVVSATVTGTVRTGQWRLIVSRPGGTERLRVFIERGDIDWGGAAVVQRRSADGRWVTVVRERLDGEGRLAHTLCASAIGACVAARTVIAPHPGAQDLQAGFRLQGHGRWTVTGAVRQASEPFIYGRWLDSPVDDLRF